MEKLTINEAKNNFDQLLVKVQSEPVQILMGDKPVAVFISIDEYQATEKLKLQMLKNMLKRTEQQIKEGQYSDGDEFFKKPLTEDFETDKSLQNNKEN